MLNKMRIQVALAFACMAAMSACAGQKNSPVERSAPPKAPTMQQALQPEAEAASSGPMSLVGLETALRKIDPQMKGKPGFWEFTFQGVRLTCLAQENADRMRIFTPVARLQDVTSEQLERAMNANFHSALDARYASARGFLFSAFIHPLASLDDRELRSAVFQVASLAVTFGSDYTSGVMRFGPTPGKRI